MLYEWPKRLNTSKRAELVTNPLPTHTTPHHSTPHYHNILQQHHTIAHDYYPYPHNTTTPTGTQMTYCPPNVAYTPNTNKFLRYVDFADCTQATGGFITDFLGPQANSKCPVLQNLCLRGCRQLAFDRYIFQKILLRCPSLRWIDLSFVASEKATSPLLSIFDAAFKSGNIRNKKPQPHTHEAGRNKTPKDHTVLRELRKAKIHLMKKSLSSLTKFSLCGNEGFTKKSDYQNGFTKDAFFTFEEKLLIYLGRMKVLPSSLLSFFFSFYFLSFCFSLVLVFRTLLFFCIFSFSFIFYFTFSFSSLFISFHVLYLIFYSFVLRICGSWIYPTI